MSDLSKKAPRIEPALLRDLIHYDPDTGQLTWKARRPVNFTHCKRDPAWVCRIWNAKYEGRPAFGRREHGYIAGRVFGAHVYAHQVAFAIMTGQWPEAQIDHVNGRRSDNRWRNLRPTDSAQNARNTAISRSNSSGVVGVSWNREKRRWWAYIHPAKGRRHLLGSFRSKADAVAVRKAAERHYGYHQNHGRKPAS
ncbi:HNH endonuclease [Rhodosalinus sediminis]|uniref:HNH endonuclease n=2 Tax=Rhodosalinus TaxID=2047740 RepID=A0A3D9BKF3_9RHOB|nr:HNH endonuclease [Rhodosalinus sediminis]REC53831.1 HNH endonuclease [Rhodosalinus sediminis]